MGNMSYCRFRNTEGDLGDCIEAIQYREIRSEEEREAAVRMLRTFTEFLEDEGIVVPLDDYDERIENLIDECEMDI